MEKPSNGVDILDGHFTCYDDGTIWSNKSNRFVGAEKESGYILVRYAPESTSRGKDIKAHRLIAHAFLGLALDSDLTVDHKNGIKSDNRPCNLEIVTRSTNVRRAAKCTFSWEDVLVAVQKYDSLLEIKKSLGYIGKDLFGYCFDIFGKDLHEAIQEFGNIKILGKRLSEKVREDLTLVELNNMKNTHKTWANVAKVLGISPSTLSKILKEKRNAYNNPSDSSN